MLKIPLNKGTLVHVKPGEYDYGWRVVRKMPVRSRRGGKYIVEVRDLNVKYRNGYQEYYLQDVHRGIISFAGPVDA